MSITDELLENTAGHAWALTHGALLLPPAKRVAVLACMDACLNVHRILGLKEPDAGVIRTAAGVVSDDAIGSPLALPATARDRGNRTHPPHRLRHADLRR